MMRVIILLAQVLLCTSVFAQNLTSRIVEGERLMEQDDYTAAKQQFELAASEVQGSYGKSLVLRESEENERLQNDLLEARIMTGEFDKALESFNETIIFSSYREGIRHYHLECLLHRQDPMIKRFGRDAVEKVVLQARNAFSLLEKYRSEFTPEDYSDLRIVLIDDMLHGYYLLKDYPQIQSTMNEFAEETARVPVQRRIWPEFFGLCQGRAMLNKPEKAEYGERLINLVLKHMRQFNPSFVRYPLNVLLGIAEKKGDKEEYDRINAELLANTITN